jgi:hypothetical protein
MEADLLNELQLLCKDVYEASQTGEITSPTLLRKYVTHFTQILRNSGTGQTIADLVADWLEQGQGKFYSKQMYAELGLSTRADKKAADMALRRMAEKNIVQPCGETRGCWRPVAVVVEEIDWESAETTDIIPLIFPLDLHEHWTLYPTNVVVVAGEKNSGKTSLMLNLIYLNALTIGMPMVYFSSEMAAQELKVRVKAYPSREPFRQTTFKPLDYDSVVDVIEPDAINIIDFLEVEDEFWLVGKKIRKMWEKLQKGIVIVAVQKDPDSKLGRGKAFSTEKARVYLTMTKRQNLCLEEIKNYKGDKKPDGMVIPYQFGINALIEKRLLPQPKLKPNMRVLPRKEV